MRSFILFVMLAAGTAAGVGAQDQPQGLQGDVLATLDDARTKIVRLAEAMPDDKLTWRPSEGVRSVSEAMVHVAAANYLFGSMLGTEVPEGLNPGEFEKTITQQEAIVETVNDSFDHITSILNGLSDEALEAPVQWFGGQERPARFIIHFMSVHAHEHLGQLIAYARMNGIVPPWSE